MLLNECSAHIRGLAATVTVLFGVNAAVVAETAPTAIRALGFNNIISGNDTNRAFVLEWDAVSNATYKVQARDSLAPDVPWKTLDLVTPEGGVGAYKIRITTEAQDANGVSPGSAFYQLVLPQPEIFAIEPAVLLPTGGEIFIIGQCFPSNAVVQVGDVVQTNVEFINSGLLRVVATFDPPPPGQIAPPQNVRVNAGELGPTLAVLERALEVAPGGQLLLEPPATPPASPHRYPGTVTIVKGMSSGEPQDCDDSDENLYGVTIRNPNGISSSPATITSQRSAPAGSGGKTRTHRYVGTVTIVKGMISGGAGGVDDDGNGLASAMNDWPGAFNVQPSSGELQHQVVDMLIRGRALDFVWMRSYASRTGRDTAQGRGWDFSYNVSLTQQSDGTVQVCMGNGRCDTFYPNGTNGWSRNEYFVEIRDLNGDGMPDVLFADGGRWLFNPFDPTNPAGGKLWQINDRNDNTMSLNYDGAGQLAEIVDDLGRTNRVGYTADGHVASVTDFTGRTVTYQYHTNGSLFGVPGDLASVTTPAVTGTPNTNDFPNGKTTTYNYSMDFPDERLNHNLINITDAKGQGWLQVYYRTNQDSTNFNFDAVDAVQRGAYRIKLLRDPQTPSPANQFATVKAFLNDGRGIVTECFFDSKNRCVRTLDYTGFANPDLPTDQNQNRPINPLRTNDPVFFETRWAWNLDSLCTRETLPRGNRTECVYEHDFDRNATPRKKGDLRVLRDIACCGGADTDGDGGNDLSERVWRFDYDPNFGSPALAYAHTAFNVTKRNAITATQQNEAAAMRAVLLNACSPGYGQASGRVTRIWPKGWNGTIKGRFAAGPRQTTSMDGTFSHRRWTKKNTDDAFLCVDANDSRSSFVISATDPRGLVTTANCDAKGNRVKVQFHWDRNAKEEFAYSAFGQLAAVTNAPDGNGYRRVDTAEYYDSGPQAGYLRTWTVDAQGPTLIRSTYEHDARGNVTRCIDPNTNDWLFAYNALDQCVEMQSAPLPGGSTGRFRYHRWRYYDANDNLTRFDIENLDENGAPGLNPVWRTQFQYDVLNRAVACWRDKNGNLVLRCTEAQYDANDNIVLYRSGEAVNGKDPRSVVSFQPDERDLLYRVTDAPGSGIESTNQYDYDANGNLAKIDQAKGDLNAKIETRLYDGFDRPSSVTDPMGNVMLLACDANNNVTFCRVLAETTDVPAGARNLRYHEWRWRYDGADRLVSAQTAFFDPATQKPIGDGQSTHSFSYAPNSLLLGETDALGRTTRYGYDTAHRLSSVTDARGNIVVVIRDAVGNAMSRTSTEQSDLGGPAQVFVTTCEYDVLDRLTRASDNLGNNENWFFDSRGNVVRHLDANGVLDVAEYDGLGRKLKVYVDANGDGTIGPGELQRTLAWDDNDRLTAVTDSNTNTTTYAYDARDRRVLATSPAGTHHAFTWNARNTVASSTDPNGTAVNYTYDLNDRCVRKQVVPGPGVATTTSFELYTYDGDGRVVTASNDVSRVEFTYDSAGNATRVISDGWQMLAAFDTERNRTSLTYPGGTVVQYSYDALNRVSALDSLQCSGCVAARVASFEYEGPDRLAAIVRGNGVNTRINWNGAQNSPKAAGDFGWRQVTRINHTRGAGNVVDQRTFSYDRNQNKTLRVQTVPFFVGGDMTTNIWEYTPLNQLRRAINTKGTGAVARGYNLDGQGNRLDVTNGTEVEVYTRDATLPEPADFQEDQYTSTPDGSHQYDRGGNLIYSAPLAPDGVPTQFVYDYANRLVEVSHPGSTGVPELVASFTYDCFGRRLTKTTPGSGPAPALPVTTQFIYDGDNVIEERDGSGTVQGTYLRMSRDNIRQSVSDMLMLTRGGQNYFFHEDDLGNVLALTDASGNVIERYDYDDYGAPEFLSADGVPLVGTNGLPVRSSPSGNPFLFHSMFWDAETSYYFGHSQGATTGLRWDTDPYAEDAMRFFDPNTGRYTSRDSGNAASGEPGNELNDVNRDRLLGQNAYTFAGDNPWSARGGSGRSATLNVSASPGGAARAMQKGTVKFFNESKGFGRFVPTADAGLSQVLKTFFQTGDFPTQSQYESRRRHEFTGHVTLMK